MYNQQTENVQSKSHQRFIIINELINENTFLFCKLCKHRNGTTTFALGTTDLSLKGIKWHLATHEHKESELQLFNSNHSELNIEDQMDTSETSVNKEKSQIISLMKNVYFSSKKKFH